VLDSKGKVGHSLSWVMK